MVSLIILWDVELVVCDPVRKVGTTGFARVLAGINIINRQIHLVNGNSNSCLSYTTCTATTCTTSMNSTRKTSHT